VNARLQGKTALVTGGGAGIGLGISRRLADEGAGVVITDIDPTAGAKTAAEHGFTFVQHDVCDEEGWARVIQEVEDTHGQLDILVNNAGIFGPLTTPEDTSLEDWRSVFAINVEGAFLGCRTSIPAFRRTGSGSIVNLSSTASFISTPQRTPYGAAKASVRHLTKSMAQFYAQEGLRVRVNSIHPGHVRTPQWDREGRAAAEASGVSFESWAAARQRSIPLGEFITPEDIGATVAFLASDDARLITGAALVVDGGLTHCDTFVPPAH
jgi:NAD(P)-dependent dehydrogenase (short-subunit alcohol dehydrogenase family)